MVLSCAKATSILRENLLSSPVVCLLIDFWSSSSDRYLGVKVVILKKYFNLFYFLEEYYKVNQYLIY